MKDVVTTNEGVRKRRPPTTKGQLMRGCECHFVVNRLYEDPCIAMISYINPYHTDKADLVCHGAPCKDVDQNSNNFFSPWISLEKKTWVLNMLFRGFSPQQVLDWHIQYLHARQSSDPKCYITRDDFLSIRDIMNISRKLAIHKYQLHDDDAESTKRWCVQNESMTFVYQEQDLESNKDFILGIQTPWQREMCNKFGNGNLLSMDATFGTNKYKVYIPFSFVVYA